MLRQILLTVCCAILPLAGCYRAPAAAGSNNTVGRPAPYLVTFTSEVKDPNKLTTELAEQFHFVPTHRFNQLIVGFAARLTPEVAAALGKDPRVANIELDRGLTP